MSLSSANSYPLVLTLITLLKMDSSHLAVTQEGTLLLVRALPSLGYHIPNAIYRPSLSILMTIPIP